MLLAATADGAFAGDLAAAGVDRIVAYHSSVYRQRGLPSVAGLLPWASANEQTLGALPSVVAAAGSVPVVATVCANDGLLPADDMLDRIIALGAVGVLNAPTVGLFTGPVRAVLEESGLGLRTEIDLLAAARARGLEAWAYVFDPASAVAAHEVGATGLVLHLGITGHPGDPSRTAADVVAGVLAAVPSTGVLLHGGNLRGPDDLVDLLTALPGAERARITGFFGASAFESRPPGVDVGTVLTAWRTALDPDDSAEHPPTRTPPPVRPAPDQETR
ncbi:phosphoenolpyruvate hydrolase family protein [Nakamurella flavida]|nr:phosphoenolpyruvate hydrolase family protein [Nakamurella flavida]